MGVDDRRSYLSVCFPVQFYVQDLKTLIFIYLGCLACDDPEAQKYKIKCIDWTGMTPCAPLPLCENNCRYCGLSSHHHYNNREIPTPIAYLDELNSLYHPYRLYCDIRCPIQLCSDCCRPFVKIAEVHLCAQCLVKFRSQPKMKQLWKPIGQNRYKDEIDQYVVLPQITLYRKKMIQTKGGRKEVTEAITRIDKKAADIAVREFLDRTEYTCGVCHSRFRLSLIAPRIVLDVFVCGFCALPHV